jgi:hypothetical protein
MTCFRFLGCGWEMKDSFWRISEFSNLSEFLKIVSKKIRFSEYWNWHQKFKILFSWRDVTWFDLKFGTVGNHPSSL